MSEHKHDWRMVPCSWNMSVEAMCINENCSAELDQGEIERRLNATECLSADDACIAADVVFDDRAGTIPDNELEDWVGSLRNYADTLEGKE